MNIGLYASGQTLGPLPWGIYKQEVARSIFMYEPADIVGKPPPADAKTISVEDYQNLEGEVWNGMFNTDLRDPTDVAKRETPSQFWKDWLKDPSYYGTPKGTAADLWATKQARLKEMGITSEAELLKIFQSDPQRSQEICLKLGAGFYITSTAGSGATKLVVTKGFKPYSDLWDLRVTSAAIATELVDGASPDWIIDSLEKRGYTKAYIKKAFESTLAAHGTSFKPDLTWGAGNIPQEWWGTLDKGTTSERKIAPVVRTVREPTWMLVTDQMLKDRGGKITLPGGGVMTKPGFIVFQTGIPPQGWLETNKINIGEFKGGRDLTLYVDGNFLEYLTTNKDGSMKSTWDIMQKSSQGAADPRVLAEYAKWCIGRSEEWKLTGYSPLPPSKVLKEYGINPSIYDPDPSSAARSLFMRSFIPTGQQGAMSADDAILVQQTAQAEIWNYAKAMAKKDLGTDPTDEQIKKKLDELLSRYSKLVLDEYTKLLDNYIKAGGVDSYTLPQAQERVAWLASQNDPTATKIAQDIADAWNERGKAWLGLADRLNSGKLADKLPASLGGTMSPVDEYTVTSAGYVWSKDKEEWEFRGVQRPSNVESKDQYPGPQFPGQQILPLPKLLFLDTLTRNSYGSQITAVKLPAQLSGSTPKLRNLVFTMALFSPDYSNYPVAKLNLLSVGVLGGVSYAGAVMDNQLFLLLAAGLLCLWLGYRRKA